MLYVGHFSFDETGSGNQLRHGYFTCMVDAEDADKAASKFKEYILSLKETVKIFHGIIAVYIEDIIKVESVPEQPVIIRFQSSEGQFPKSISMPHPITDTPGIELYGLAQDVNRTKKKGEASFQESIPFIEFQSTAG